MSLMLTGTWEHALLAKVVQEAANVSEEQGSYLGRTAIQKIVYFLQVRNVPMRYRFELYHYGPFCNSILGDLDWLMADEVVSDASPQPEKFSRYKPGRSIGELIEQHAPKLRECEPTIKNVVTALLPLKPNHLELIATLDYSFRETKANLGRKPAKDDVIARFREFKGDKFQVQVIASTYDQLEKAGLLT